jgi:hypothetical protein
LRELPCPELALYHRCVNLRCNRHCDVEASNLHLIVSAYSSRYTWVPGSIEIRYVLHMCSALRLSACCCWPVAA